MTTFVLIHGTTQTPSGWDRLARELTGRGHQPVAVDVAAGPAVPVTDYPARVAAQVPDGDGDVVAVAHSGAGPLLRAVGAAVGARHLVWLAAFVPDLAGGRTLIQEVRADPAAVFNPDWIGVDPSADPALATRFLFHDCDPDTLRWALTTIRISTAMAGYDAAGAPAGAPPASTYILPTGDRTLLPAWMRTAATERLRVTPVEIPGGHCPHVSRPRTVADILTHLAGTRPPVLA